jgi:hypothetical protein
MSEILEVKPKSKRGRKPKIKPTDDVTNNNTILSDETIDNSKPVGKKRGRKPKEGKINTVNTNINKPITKTNVILHLNCNTKDLITVNNDTQIDSYNFNNEKKQVLCNNNYNNISNNKYNTKDYYKIIDYKLKELTNYLHLNINNNKSDCFSCHHSYDNYTIYIPKFKIGEIYHVYGSFCSPECAVSYLLNENIDTSVKYERLYLLNFIYANIYDYTKNIKPAPNVYYTLDKYEGNLSIKEYRTLLNNDRLYSIVDKPLTRTMPELHEDNDDHIINNKIIPSYNSLIKKNTNLSQK